MPIHWVGLCMGKPSLGLDRDEKHSVEAVLGHGWIDQHLLKLEQAVLWPKELSALAKQMMVISIFQIPTWKLFLALSYICPCRLTPQHNHPWKVLCSQRVCIGCRASLIPLATEVFCKSQAPWGLKTWLLQSSSVTCGNKLVLFRASLMALVAEIICKSPALQPNLSSGASPSEGTLLRFGCNARL